MTMLLILIILVFLAGGLGYLYKQARKAPKKEKDLVSEYKQSIKERDRAIKALEEVYREEGEKKKKIHTGSDSDKFSASLDIMSDLSKTGAKARADKDKP